MSLLSFFLFCTEAIKSTFYSDKNAKYLGNQEVWASSFILCKHLLNTFIMRDMDGSKVKQTQSLFL